MKRIITQYPDYREYAPINTQVNVYYSAADEQDLIDDSVDIVTKHRMYEDFKYFFYSRHRDSRRIRIKADFQD